MRIRQCHYWKAVIEFGWAVIQFWTENNETMCMYMSLGTHSSYLCWQCEYSLQYLLLSICNVLRKVFKAYEWKMAENVFRTLAMNRTLYRIHWWAYGCALLIQPYAEDLKCHCVAFVCYWWGDIVFVFVYNRQKISLNGIIPNISMSKIFKHITRYILSLTKTPNIHRIHPELNGLEKKGKFPKRQKQKQTRTSSVWRAWVMRDAKN